jgi:hypothetical protein
MLSLALPGRGTCRRMEHEDQVDRLEREVDKMEQEAERVGGDIEDARRDWEAKEADASVPGAQPSAEEQDASESDQLPEEGPAEQVPDDTGDGSRDEAERTPGVPGEEERGTGHPDHAEEHGKQ